jgi:hypothetical protein
MDSSYTTQSFTSNSDTSIQEINIQNNDKNNENYKDSKYNDLKYILPSNDKSNIYIFENNLFTRQLLPIDYKKERQILVQCTTCNYKKVEYIKGFQASNFARHYKAKHLNIAYNKESEKNRLKKSNNSTNITNFFNTNTTTTLENRKRIRNNTITEFDENEAYTKILTFIIENNLSFNILESESFKDLLNYYNKTTTNINRKKITKLLNDKFDNYSSTFNTELQKNIDKNGRFSITFDLWTSNVNQIQIFGIIIIFIDEYFKLNYKLIGFDELNEIHTGKYIYTEFSNIINDFPAIKNNILSFTRDNASNNDKFIEYYKTNTNSNIYDIRCVSHILNLVVNDILREYLLKTKNNTTNTNLNITSKIRRISTILKYNTEPKKLFYEGIQKYKNDGIIPSNYNITLIPLDNSTRWNSTYKMIKTTLELKDAIIYVSKNTNNDEFQNIILNNNEWEALEELKNIFEIFVKPTTKLQGQIYTTLNYTLLYIYRIYRQLKDLLHIYKDKARNARTNYYNNYISAINNGLEKLDKYYPQIITPTEVKKYKAFIISIILDPRLKLNHFEENGLLYFYPNIKNDVITMLKFEYIKIKNEIQSLNITNVSFDELQDDIYNASNNDSNSDDEFYTKTEKTEDEYISYITENTISSKINPLEYWKNNEYKYPILAILARRFLAIPATSASIESTFSIATNIITKNRNRLLPMTAKRLILLKSWKIKDLEELEKIKKTEEKEEEMDENNNN